MNNIRIESKDYCTNCPYFCVRNNTIWADGKPAIHIIGCENDYLCEKLMEHLKSKVNSEVKDEH